MTDPITFHASLPPIKSAIYISGQEGDGAQVKLEIPGTDRLAALKLAMLAGLPLIVTVEVDETKPVGAPVV